VYSISSRSSFASIRQFHAQVLRVKESRTGSGPFVCLVGNKCDRVDEREVSTQEGFVLARELGCEFFEASSKRCINVEESFYGQVRAIQKQRTTVPQKAESPGTMRDGAVLSRDRPQPQRPSKFSSLTGLFRSRKSPNNNPRSLDVI
jgi:GTPase KRas protein